MSVEKHRERERPRKGQGIRNESRMKEVRSGRRGSVLGGCCEWAGKMEWTGCMGPLKGTSQLYTITLIPPVSTHQSAILARSSW